MIFKDPFIPQPIKLFRHSAITLWMAAVIHVVPTITPASHIAETSGVVLRMKSEM